MAASSLRTTRQNKKCLITVRLFLTLPLIVASLLSTVAYMRLRFLQQVQDNLVVHYEAIGPWGESLYVADPQALLKARYKKLQDDPSLTDLDLLEHFHPEHLQAPFEGDEVCGESGRRWPVDPEGLEILTKKISIDHSPAQGKHTHRILCGMYTHDGNRDLARAAAITWGYKCDGFLAFSTNTVPELGMVRLEHDGPEVYDNMWQKTRSILAYMHDHYADDYDYFHLGGDDVLLIVENLRRFLIQFEQVHKNSPDQPLFLGQERGKLNGKSEGVVGGAGYLVNRVALRRLMTHILPTCKVDTKNAAEDRIISFCFKQDGILPGESRDLETGEQMFHCKSPKQVYLARADPSRGGFPETKVYWENQAHPTLPNQKVGVKDGLDAAAQYSVAFHNLKTPLYIARVHAILYGTCPKGTKMAESIHAAKGGVERAEPVEEPGRVEPPKQAMAPPKKAMAPPKQAPPKKAPPKQAPAKQAPPKKAPSKQTPAKKAPAKKAPPKQAMAPPKQAMAPPKQVMAPPKQTPPRQTMAPPIAAKRLR